MVIAKKSKGIDAAFFCLAVVLVVFAVVYATIDNLIGIIVSSFLAIIMVFFGIYWHIYPTDLVSLESSFIFFAKQKVTIPLSDIVEIKHNHYRSRYGRKLQNGKITIITKNGEKFAQSNVVNLDEVVAILEKEIANFYNQVSPNKF